MPEEEKLKPGDKPVDIDTSGPEVDVTLEESKEEAVIDTAPETKTQEVVEEKKAEYKKTFVEAVYHAKNPPFDSWERAELIKLADNDKARLLSNGKISISRETGITFQERTNILKEIRSIEGSLQYRAEVDPTQTIQVGDNAPQNLQQMIISDSEVAKTRDRLL